MGKSFRRLRGPLDPIADFRDDGGTPDFRRRQAYGPLIIVEQKGFAAWWRRASVFDVFLFVLIGCALLAAIVFFGGLAIAYLLTT